MARLCYDLHIHSALSPCADDDMTPGNICAMARLKGLDLIAVCDHQSAGMLPALAACARREGLLLLPGIEVCPREEAHILCYFDSLDAAARMGAWCRGRLPDTPNRPDYFGEQWLMDEEDRVIGREERMLILALRAGLDEVTARCRALGGVPVPAHVNRGSHGILTALGFLPAESGFTALEVCPHLPCEADLSGYRLLRSSDAHRLQDISEAVHHVEAERSAGAVLAWLRGEGPARRKTAPTRRS